MHPCVKNLLPQPSLTRVLRVLLRVQEDILIPSTLKTSAGVLFPQNGRETLRNTRQ